MKWKQPELKWGQTGAAWNWDVNSLGLEWGQPGIGVGAAWYWSGVSLILEWGLEQVELANTSFKDVLVCWTVRKWVVGFQKVCYHGLYSIV